MKKIIILIIVLLGGSLLVQARQKNGVTIQGKVAGLKNGTKVYITTKKSKNDTIAVTRAINDQFEFKNISNISPGTSYAIFLDDTVNTAVDKNGQRNNYLFVRFPDVGKTIHISAEIAEWKNDLTLVKLSGNGASEAKEFVEFKKALNALNIKKAPTQDSYKLYRDFINTHPDSYYSAFLMNTLVMAPASKGGYTPEESALAFSKLSTRVKISEPARELEKEIQRKLTSQALKGGKGKLNIGDLIPDLKSKDINGNSISIKTAISKGKYTLIDFWASWCGPCRAETPNLKMVYDKYHDRGFNILGISLDTNESTWKDVVKKDQMNWQHVSDLKGYDSICAIVFDVKFVPYSVLVDAEGHIVQINGLRAEKLETKLAMLLK